METHIGVGVGKYIEKELDSAKEYVWVSTPAVSLSLGKKLFEMLNRGIKIRILTSSSGANDSDLTNQLARELMTPTEGSDERWTPPPLEYKIASSKEIALIHAKLYVIDGKCAIIGSANLTENSFWNYAEYIWVLRETEHIAKVREDYEKLWISCHDSKIDVPGTKKDLKDMIKKIRRKL